MSLLAVTEFLSAGRGLVSHAPDDCAVCKEPAQDCVTIAACPCKAYYCLACITEWLQEKDTCPTCRVRLLRSESEGDDMERAGTRADFHVFFPDNGLGAQQTSEADEEVRGIINATPFMNFNWPIVAVHPGFDCPYVTPRLYFIHEDNLDHEGSAEFITRFSTWQSFESLNFPNVSGPVFVDKLILTDWLLNRVNNEFSDVQAFINQHPNNTNAIIELLGVFDDMFWSQHQAGFRSGHNLLSVIIDIIPTMLEDLHPPGTFDFMEEDVIDPGVAVPQGLDQFQRIVWSLSHQMVRHARQVQLFLDENDDPRPRF